MQRRHEVYTVLSTTAKHTVQRLCVTEERSRFTSRVHKIQKHQLWQPHALRLSAVSTPQLHHSYTVACTSGTSWSKGAACRHTGQLGFLKHHSTAHFQHITCPQGIAVGVDLSARHSGHGDSVLLVSGNADSMQREAVSVRGGWSVSLWEQEGGSASDASPGLLPLPPCLGAPGGA